MPSDREIEAQLERFEDRSDGEPPAPNGKKRNQKNAPRFDVQGQLYRMTGVDLTRIDGVDAYTALKVISEIGADMTKWPSAKHFASWLAQPQQPHHRRQGHQLKDQTQRQPGRRGIASGGNALHRSDSALGAFLRRKKAQLGAPKAITATAHKLARLIYSMLRHGPTWMPALNTTNASISTGVARRQTSGGTIGTAWCQCRMSGTAPRTNLPARWPPRDGVG